MEREREKLIMTKNVKNNFIAFTFLSIIDYDAI